MTTPPAISFEGVTKHYRGGGGVTGLTFHVSPGEVFGLLGPNGAGKSTAIRLLVDLIRPVAGTISVFGRDLAHHSVEVRQCLGYLPGDFATNSKATGGKSFPPWVGSRDFALRHGLPLPPHFEPIFIDPWERFPKAAAKRLVSLVRSWATRHFLSSMNQQPVLIRSSNNESTGKSAEQQNKDEPSCSPHMSWPKLVKWPTALVSFETGYWPARNPLTPSRTVVCIL